MDYKSYIYMDRYTVLVPYVPISFRNDGHDSHDANKLLEGSYSSEERQPVETQAHLMTPGASKIKSFTTHPRLCRKL
jgi:hypothetical protein